ncbi:MAG: hypothetical protein IPK97_21375 [Ahniella sp.]|nr:hypothetical protein [Ahniella sp.]
MNSIIADNVISNIARTNTGATGGFTVGIAGANATRTTITRNRISGLSNSSTSTTLTVRALLPVWSSAPASPSP